LFGTTRSDALWHASIPVNNTLAPVVQDARVLAARPGNPDLLDEESFPSVFVPKTPEPYTYDLDGNLLTDGRFTYTFNCVQTKTYLASFVHCKGGKRFVYIWT
jgi:hypothetical protein